MENFRSINIALWIIALFVVGYLVMQGAVLLIPLLIAALIAFSIIAITSFLESKWIPEWWWLALSLLVHVLGMMLIVSLLNTNLTIIIKVLPTYQDRFYDVAVRLFEAFWQKAPSDLAQMLQQFDFTLLATWLLTFVQETLANMALISIYVVFFLFEHKFFKTKLIGILWKGKWLQKTEKIIEKIQKDVTLYFVVKVLVSSITATLSYLFLKTMGFDLAWVAGMLIFVLNFIPTVWSIVAVLFPMMISLVQYESLLPFVVITLVLWFIQVMMGNILEPKFVGNRLNVSPLIILFNLALRGVLRGIPGMFLSVPIIVGIKSILSQFETTRAIAIALSEKGEA